MVKRLITPSRNSSFYLFGARGTGKSTWVEKEFIPSLKNEYMYINLLDDLVEEQYLRAPNILLEEVLALKNKPQWIIIDEVQKVPRLLDVVHLIIEKFKIKFLLTGSSARKLKLSGANMLGGRAFDYRLYPFSFIELKNNFDLSRALNFGLIPKALEFESSQDKQKFLKSYVQSYIKMEVQLEQLVRKIEPFRNFLEIAAQMNGKILNFNKIAKDIGVSDKTILSYYEILEETYLGFRLPAYHHSLRKSQLTKPKFYFFDVGVKRALDASVRSDLVESTSLYGETFEHFIIIEIFKLNSYLEADYKISYFETADHSEIDLILTRGREKIFIEIKSSDQIDMVEVRKLAKYTKEFKAKSYYLSRHSKSRMIEGVHCLHWEKVIQEIFEY